MKQIKSSIKNNWSKFLKSQKSCPSCNSKNLLKLGVDLLCCDCDWESTRTYVQQGHMDSLSAAEKDHLPPSMVQQKEEMNQMKDRHRVQFEAFLHRI